MLKLKQKVTLSPRSLYASKAFQKEGSGHLKVDKAGVVTKVGTDLEEGWYTVKFRDGSGEKSNTYIEGLLVKV